MEDSRADFSTYARTVTILSLRNQKNTEQGRLYGTRHISLNLLGGLKENEIVRTVERFRRDCNYLYVEKHYSDRLDQFKRG